MGVVVGHSQVNNQFSVSPNKSSEQVIGFFFGWRGGLGGSPEFDLLVDVYELELRCGGQCSSSFKRQELAIKSIIEYLISTALATEYLNRAVLLCH